MIRQDGGGLAYFNGLRRALAIQRSTPWAMITAYFDESGTHDGSKILVVAGVVSPADQWQRLIRSWERVLAEKKLRVFHTVDCAHRRNAFEGWGKSECHALYLRLVNLTKRHVLWRTWTAILVPEYLQFFYNEAKDQAHYMAYSVCALGCVSRVRMLAQSLNQSFPYVFERGGLGGQLAKRMFAEMIGNEEQESYRMSSVAFDSPNNLIPLQVADLHAYEVRKYFSDQMEGERREPRRSFQELLRITEAGGGGYLFTMDKLKIWIDAMRSGKRIADVPVDLLNRETRVALEPLDPTR